jgi:diketogulonate reductase-like aldo/keto reductase
MIPQTSLPSGENIPVLGQGSWNIGDNRQRRDDEIAALRLWIDLGMTLIDTAEMYGNGASEQLVGEAIAGRRNEVFLVSKVLPSNASRRGTVRACERSLRRLGTDRLDLYLLHWRGQYGLHEMVSGMEELRAAGKIRHWGVSNLDLTEMDDLMRIADGVGCATDQLLYNLARRGIEYDLLPWSRDRGMPVMAYSPLDEGRLLKNAAVGKVAEMHGVTRAQVALGWLLRRDGVVAIPKAANERHVRENAASLELSLNGDDLALLDDAFPPPARPQPLDMI